MNPPDDPRLRAFERHDIDEPIDVRLARWTIDDLDATLDACSELPRPGRIVIVLALPRAATADDARRVVARAGLLAHTLVVVADGDALGRWGALSPADLRSLARGFGEARVAIEPAPGRAVIGAMQWLRQGDTFVLLWPRLDDMPDPGSLVRCGAAWRRSWDATEDDGEFHSAPRGIDGAPIPLQPGRRGGGDERMR